MEKRQILSRKQPGTNNSGHPAGSRRQFLRSITAMGGISLFPVTGAFSGVDPFHVEKSSLKAPAIDGPKTIIGQYGPWAATLNKDPGPLSFRNPQWESLGRWKKQARNKVVELTAAPELGETNRVTVNKKYTYDGLDIEELSWQLPYGTPTEAILLKPSGATQPLPAILGLHDHSGDKYLGKRKITRTSDDPPDFIIAHQDHGYEGKAWANEIAKKGYVVLVHDAFAFGSRRVTYDNVEGITWGTCNVEGKPEVDPGDPETIKVYNEWAGAHEHILSKSLFCAGTTWPGVCLAEDKKALEVLADRSDVDKTRIGCGGLSGGGLRTVYLAGLDPRIKCAVCVGFLTTWDDFLLNKAYTHTWMTYTPLLPNYLDFPEILGLQVPLPVMALNNEDDPLYTLPEMKKADRILQEVYSKAGVPGHYKSGFYPGPHKFDIAMQQDAFEWFDRWLKV